jgi:hypothetical protein
MYSSLGHRQAPAVAGATSGCNTLLLARRPPPPAQPGLTPPPRPAPPPRSGSGTVTHLAPELLVAGSKITTAVDTWAFGVRGGLARSPRIVLATLA